MQLTVERERRVRYPKSRDMQCIWEKGIRDELEEIRTNIVFFEEFSGRHWSEHGISKKTSLLLEDLRSDEIRLKDALANGDYATT